MPMQLIVCPVWIYPLCWPFPSFTQLEPKWLRPLDNPNEHMIARKHQLKLEKKNEKKKPKQYLASSNEGIGKGGHFLPEV